ncbi:Factor of DNA methylation 1 [Striga hermonthica]|uniref:Factor of DNA methylation 1 n=1 Tax=Striga hermonthica TaxID=68872 RepID=A0A9N7MZ97_STRHE|nr:Factor of DNA methylation 1 [Striga hermonthica]
MGGGPHVNASDSEFEEKIMLQERDHLCHAFSEEIRKLESILKEHAKVYELREVLDDEKRRLHSWSEELTKREALIKSERLKLRAESEELTKRKALIESERLKLRAESAMAKAKMQTRHLSMIARDLFKPEQREKEAALRKVVELERSFEREKQRLELEIELLEAKLEMMKKMGDADENCDDIWQKIEMMSKPRQEGFKKLIVGLYNLLIISSNHIMGTKRVAKIDTKDFRNACSLRFPLEQPEIMADELCSLWQEKLKNPEWNPFTFVEYKRWEPQWVVNKDDELLRGLEYKWGHEAYDAVITALKVLQSYDPSGSYVVPQLWSFMKNKAATLEEVVRYIIVQLRTFKRIDKSIGAHDNFCILAYARPFTKSFSFRYQILHSSLRYPSLVNEGIGITI